MTKRTGCRCGGAKHGQRHQGDAGHHQEQPCDLPEPDALAQEKDGEQHGKERRDVARGTGNGGVDTLDVFDQKSQAAASYHLSVGMLADHGQARINYEGIGTLRLFGSAAPSNTYDVDATATAARVAMSASRRSPSSSRASCRGCRDGTASTRCSSTSSP